MAVVPGEQIGGCRRGCGFLSSWQSDCYGHPADDGMRRPCMSKPSNSFPRPLAALLGATLSDAYKQQGFASAELIARWADIAGPEVAAHSQPIKINWPRVNNGGAPGDDAPEPATLVLRVEGPAALEI